MLGVLKAQSTVSSGLQTQEKAKLAEELYLYFYPGQ